MRNQSKNRAFTKALNRNWLWVVLAAVALLATVIYLWRIQSQPMFRLQQGEKSLLVLLRNEDQAAYQVQYTGRRPTELKSLQVMLAGKILHVDVVEVALARPGEELVLLGDGSLPEGRQWLLQPGDTFSVRITFRGQTLGYNYLYGFRMLLASGDQERTYELVLDFDYAIQVE
jgi:hypothetical protein